MNSQISRLVKNMLIYGGGDVMVRFINIILLPLFTVYLTPQDFGIYSILGILILLLTSILSLGLSAAIGPCYFEGNNLEQKERTMGTSFSLLALSVASLCLIGLLFSSRLCGLLFHNTDHIYLIRLTLISIGSLILMDPLNLYLRFEEKAKTVVLISIASAVTTLLLCVLMVTVLKRGIKGWVEAMAISRLISLIVLFCVVTLNIKFRFCFRTLKELLKLGLPLLPAFLFLFLLTNGNKYILKDFEGLAALGVYQVGLSIGSVFAIVVQAFRSAWYPFFMSFMNKPEDARLLFGRIFSYYMIGAGMLSLMFFVWAKPVIFIMTESKFHEAYRVVGFSAAAQFFMGLFSLQLPPIYFAKQVGLLSIVQGAAVIVAFYICILFITLWGIVGAAASLAAGFACMAGTLTLWNYRRRESYTKIVYEPHRIIGFALFAVFVGVIMLWNRDISLFAEIIFSLSVTILLLYCCFVFFLNNEERRKFKSYMQRLLNYRTTTQQIEADP